LENAISDSSSCNARATLPASLCCGPVGDHQTVHHAPPRFDCGASMAGKCQIDSSNARDLLRADVFFFDPSSIASPSGDAEPRCESHFHSARGFCSNASMDTRRIDALRSRARRWTQGTSTPFAAARVRGHKAHRRSSTRVRGHETHRRSSEPRASADTRRFDALVVTRVIDMRHSSRPGNARWHLR